jgi:hypothetical protein
MFTERTDMSRSSRIPRVPSTPFVPGRSVLSRNGRSIEAPMFALRSVNGGWEGVERKYLENVRRASRPSAHWYVSVGASRPSAHWYVSDAQA